MLYFIKRSLACLPKETFVHLYSALVRPHLEYAIKATLKKDIDHLERIQKALTSTIQPKFSRTSGLENRHLNCFIKPGEPEKGAPALPAGLSNTGIACFMQSHRCHGSVHSKNYLTHTFTHNVCFLFYIRPNMVFLGDIFLSDH